MRIWLQKHVILGRMPALDDWYREHISAVVDPGTEVVIRTLPSRTYATEIPYDYVPYGAIALRFADYFARTAVQAERDGYDAWCIAAGQDPGLAAARSLAAIPTLGYGSTAFHYCAREGVRFGLIGFVPGLREVIRDNARRYGTDHLMAGYGLLEDGKSAVLEAIGGSPQRFLDTFAETAAQAAAAGAQVIIPAEGLPAEALWHLGVRSIENLPVLDPLGLLLKSAELEVRLRSLGCAARPATGYWHARPDPAVTGHIDDVFPPWPVEQDH